MGFIRAHEPAIGLEAQLCQLQVRLGTLVFFLLHHALGESQGVLHFHERIVLLVRVQADADILRERELRSGLFGLGEQLGRTRELALDVAEIGEHGGVNHVGLRELQPLQRGLILFRFHERLNYLDRN